MAQQRKDDYMQKCCDFFDSADQRCNGDGRVTKLELCKELNEQGLGISAEQIVEWFSEIDADGNGCITKEEFVEALSGVPPEEIDEQRLVAEFHKYDTNGSGFITIDELIAACRALDMETEGKQIQLDLDDNGDGKVDLQEFLRMFKERCRH